MMLHSNAAARSFTPNGLLAGLGTTLEEQSIAYKWWEHIGETFQPTPEWTARYGEGGTYSREESVTEAREDAGGGSIQEAVYAAPALYVTEACSPMDSACVARNDEVQKANLALIRNANLAVYMANCLAPADGRPCRQYEQIYVPPVPLMAGGFARPKLPSMGGQAQIGGETAAQQAASATAWETRRGAATPQQAASAVTNQPNQTVPPRGQPGEVPTGATGDGTTGDGTIGGEAAADGKILGLEPMTLAVIAAVGVGALMLLKK